MFAPDDIDVKAMHVWLWCMLSSVCHQSMFALGELRELRVFILGELPTHGSSAHIRFEQAIIAE